MAGGEDAREGSGALTEGQAERMLAGMNEVIRAGEEMRKLRAEMVKLFFELGWTQDKIAELADMSQPAVSKQVAKYRTADRPPPMELHLDQRDLPWLEGRLWGLAEVVSETLDESAHCTRYVNALSRGKKRFTPQNIDELRRLLEEDLRQHHAQLPGVHRKAYDEISRHLDIPTRSTATGSASVRRALAHAIQRDRLESQA
ncbi:sigma-70 family RNA polymerase sigma factor [Streptomyces sp. BA2]|uniref:sigma-70 family RNA polymerase sigma factor n=1 Tax=Streptomyces sp. BA2 TaxID=436595 RepID=UPI0013219260|nr:sigma-70 family RNA polymerase sigma factor [Streptomyces sp. BA2]MWA15691.1 sigma-70 family RNA polymerase sigma factor [Streptomyces sp. BA2]